MKQKKWIGNVCCVVFSFLVILNFFHKPHNVSARSILNIHFIIFQFQSVVGSRSRRLETQNQKERGEKSFERVKERKKNEKR